MNAAPSITVGYNQTPEALATFRWALEVARVRHLPLHVAQAGRAAPPHGHDPDAPALSELAAHSVEWGTTITTEQVPSGSVADLARTATPGTRARHPTSGLDALLGGTTSLTIRDAACPRVIATTGRGPSLGVQRGRDPAPEHAP
jgi:hypothetical protein